MREADILHIAGLISERGELARFTEKLEPGDRLWVSQAAGGMMPAVSIPTKTFLHLCELRLKAIAHALDLLGIRE